MKLYRLLSNQYFKLFFIGGILACLTLSTTLESLSLLTDNSFDIETVDWLEDSSEENKEKKEEKKFYTYAEKSASITALRYDQFQSYIVPSCPMIILEIQLPPPRIA